MRGAGQLAGIVGSAGVPHGYTLSVWTGSMAVISRHGVPRIGEIVLFLVGARVAYALLRSGSGGAAPTQERHDAGGALCQGVALAVVVATAVACARLPGWTAWAPAAFSATVAYFAVAAAFASPGGRSERRTARRIRRPITTRRRKTHEYRA